MAVYYNEIDSFAAAWLRELIKAGALADGEVDERDIRQVEAHDLKGFIRCHFFAGIGGWELALQLAGWPADRPVWTGSCPCQPFSRAGKRQGFSDDRHLWPEWLRLIRACRPEAIFGEQVAVGAGGSSCQDKDLPTVQGRAVLLRVLRELQGQPSSGLQGMHATAGADQKGNSPEGLRAIQSMARKAQRARIGDGRSASRKNQGPAMHPDSGGNPSQDRPWLLRSVGDSVRSYQASLLECAVLGQDRLDAGIHAGERPGRAFFFECDGERLGGSAGGRSGERDPRATYQAERRLQRTLDRCFEGAPADSWLALVQDDLAPEGYACGPTVLGACSVGAPHVRQRLWFVADANSRKRRSGHAESHSRPDGRDDVGRRGETGELADAKHAERRSVSVHRADERDGQDAGRPQAHGQSGACGEVRRMADAEGTGKLTESSAWADLVWLPCRDGKTRPTQPGLFPLAHGVPARVGRLRGYGNAIVPQVAAEVIRAFLEVEACSP